MIDQPFFGLIMTNAQAVILGAVQGLTEYLPVSSSAHLVFVPKVMGWHFLSEEAFIFDVLVQLGTLVGVLIYFFTPLKQVCLSVIDGVIRLDPFHDEHARIGWLVVLASIPAAIFGLSYKDALAEYFSSPLASSYFLMLTGVILILAEWFGRAIKTAPGRFDAVVIGCAQGLALFPGISRSGATIAAGMACGLSRKNAAQFSFFMSIPVMVGASLIAGLDLVRDGELLQKMALPLSLGFLTAAVVGFLVIKWFMAFLTNQRLIWFAAYCFMLGLWGIWYF
jgi:undecaprenyl-diphosphatase